nr:response regulator [Desulfobacterales bacterium]
MEERAKKDGGAAQDGSGASAQRARRTAMNPYHVLLVDDDPFILEGIGEELENRGYRVARANSGETAIGLLQNTPFDLV